MTSSYAFITRSADPANRPSFLMAIHEDVCTIYLKCLVAKEQRDSRKDTAEKEFSRRREKRAYSFPARSCPRTSIRILPSMFFPLPSPPSPQYCPFRCVPRGGCCRCPEESCTGDAAHFLSDRAAHDVVLDLLPGPGGAGHPGCGPGRRRDGALGGANALAIRCVMELLRLEVMLRRRPDRAINLDRSRAKFVRAECLVGFVKADACGVHSSCSLTRVIRTRRMPAACAIITSMRNSSSSSSDPG